MFDLLQSLFQFLSEVLIALSRIAHDACVRNKEDLPPNQTRVKIFFITD
jgi:hypothetical protein